MTAPARDAHCSYCGRPFGPDQPWPRACAGCGCVSYRNPIPVAVLLVPVADGLLLVRRAPVQPARPVRRLHTSRGPRKGLLAFPGGFVNHGETWEEAAVRELREETGVRLGARRVRSHRILSTPDRAFILLFGLAPAQPGRVVEAFRPTDETTECVVARRPTRLAFSLHTRVLKEYFALPGTESNPH